MSENHTSLPEDYNRAFALGLVLNVTFVIAEAVFGILSDSLALLADAGHNLSDVLGLIMAWAASYMARRPPTYRHTYGWRKSSILAALFNALILLLAVGAVGWESVRRLGNPTPVEGKTIIWVAAVGVVINTATALLFISGRKRDLNIRGAFLHMAADAGVSAGVVLSGVTIVLTGWLWLDPVISLAIVLVILVGTWGLLRDSFNLTMDAVPAHIDPAEVRGYLESLPGVSEVHDLHIWALSTSEAALTAHLVKQTMEDDDELMAHVVEELHKRYDISHITIQWERGSRTCTLCCEASG